MRPLIISDMFEDRRRVHAAALLPQWYASVQVLHDERGADLRKAHRRLGQKNKVSR